MHFSPVSSFLAQAKNNTFHPPPASAETGLKSRPDYSAPPKFGGERTRRLNAKEAAAVFNVSPWSVYAMKKAGAPFTGRYCTIADLDAWWREHPDFCASRVWRDSATPQKRLGRRP